MATFTNIAPNYEIRVLGPEHISWAAAICAHTNVFHSSVWSVVYPDEQAKRLYAFYQGILKAIEHQIKSGLCVGVFDKDFKFQYESSVISGGKLHWNYADEEADGNKLLQQMDFPLVSIALAHDAFKTFDMADIEPLLAAMPKLGIIFYALQENNKGEKVNWEPTGPGQVIIRNGTNTRHDYEGKGIMKALAHFMMDNASTNGWKGFQIESTSDAVTHVWSNPLSPFRARIVSELDTWSYEEADEQGQATFPLRPATQRAVKIRVSRIDAE